MNQTIFMNSKYDT